VTRTIIPVAVLVLVTLVCIASFRRFSDRVRLAFDAAWFAAISGYFIWEGVFPIFSQLDGESGAGALSLRVAGGAWWLFGARLAVAILWFALHRDRKSREERLFSDLSAAAIYVATALIVLNSVFALPVTGVVATSGVVAIVLGLALQNTLADVFAGIAVGIEGPFRVGNRIQLDDKLEGLVVQVNWRSIRIQTDGYDIAIIPNSVVAKAEIVNRSFPSQRRAASVELSCPESAMPERVVETLMQATLLCPDILEVPGPSAAVAQLGPKRTVYKISFHVATSTELGSTKGTLLRAARRQLHYAGLLDKDRREEQARFDAGDDALTSRRLLRDVILFESLSDEQITTLAKELQSQRLEPSEVLFAQGEADKALYLVASGVIELTRSAVDVSETLGCIGAGECVGEIGLLTGAAYAVTAKARTHCLVYRLAHEALAPLLEQNTNLVAAFDKSARKGLDILHREVVARAASEIGGPGQLLTRIRNFFGFGPS
jgi:small-conductance mechanosensitive channel